MRIAYITYNGPMKYAAANNFKETTDLLPFLQSKGLDIHAQVWDDPDVDWRGYDLALLKTPWDYHQKFELFNRWLDKIESLGIRLLNDYRVVRWNLDKHYLKEIADLGFDVIPSIFLSQRWKGGLGSLFEKLGSDQLIIKPCVSSGSHNTIVLEKSAIAQDTNRVLELISKGSFIVQPFLKEIGQGEWSFIFFNGKYSHTIIKKPKAGDFRVQQIFGGTIQVASPAQQDIDHATAYVSRFAAQTLYARVDGVMVGGSFKLMELELVEPFLYLSYGADAVQRYYQALADQIKG